ncbi:MAG: hypothetical protein WA624_09240 [Methylocella sp.]
MPDTPEFQEIIAKLRDFAAAEYKRGERDAIARIMHAAQSSGGGAPEIRANPGFVGTIRGAATQTQPETKEQRAPRGAPEAFVRQVLTSVGSEGVVASDIPAFAKTDTEHLVSDSAIRFILAKGRETGWCQNMGGRWFLKGKEGKN